MGEPWLTRWSPTDFERILSKHGLNVVDHPSLDDLVERYFSGRTDGLAPDGVTRLLAASVE